MSKGRVLCAMSGGVDSSVAAALLLAQGYEVIGVTMQIWPDLPDDLTVKEEHTGCCSLSAVEDARSVADRLAIPYYVLNFKQAFETRVIDYFIAEYAQGRTPNPCIACNRYIKFDALLDKALQLECDFVATGHYAQVVFDEGRARWLLKKSADPRKDQTYVLFNMTQAQLARTLLPLGGMTKDETRACAEAMGLRTFNKPDSQEICFVHTGDYTDFLADRIPGALTAGPILSTSGEVLGTHQGLPRYTIGQRKGLGVAAGRPLYVVDIDPARNALIVGDKAEVHETRLLAADLNWIAIPGLAQPRRAAAKIRSTAREEACTVLPLPDGRAEAVFDEPQHAITPGQAVVFYDGDAVLGGGTIEREIGREG